MILKQLKRKSKIQCSFIVGDSANLYSFSDARTHALTSVNWSASVLQVQLEINDTKGEPEMFRFLRTVGKIPSLTFPGKSSEFFHCLQTLWSGWTTSPCWTTKMWVSPVRYVKGMWANRGLNMRLTSKSTAYRTCSSADKHHQNAVFVHC